MNALTLHQPWASLMALGVKTIETRSWPAPQSAIGQRFVIHAGKGERWREGERLGQWSIYRGDSWNPPRMFRGGDPTEFVTLPLGAIVASGVLADCVPMRGQLEDEEPIPHALVLDHDGAALFFEGDPFAIDLRRQLPYGDFRPGRWAWLFEDVKPTSERCPACWGEDHCRVCGAHPGMRSRGVDPIPATGRQRIWRWEP